MADRLHLAGVALRGRAVTGARHEGVRSSRPGWLGQQLRWLLVACGVALMPFAADLASQAHIRAIERHHPGSAISTPVAAPVPPRA